MWLFIFLAVTLILFLLPLLPSLIELQLATDTRPLKVIQDYDGNIRHFALGFRSYIEKNFANLFSSNEAEGAKAKEGMLRDETPFVITGSDGQLKLNSNEVNKRATSKLIVSIAPLNLPNNFLFESEIYSKESVKTGLGDRFRAMLAEGDITLARDCDVYRWIHSNATLYVNEGCRLFGRASAGNAIYLSGNCGFERLNAGKVVCESEKHLSPINLRKDGKKVLDNLPHVKDRYERRWLVEGDIHIPAGSFFDGDLVATKSVTIGAGSVITGSIKSNRNMFIESGVCVDGSLVSAGNIAIESDCNITGSVIAENAITLERRNIIGVDGTPISITAPVVTINGEVIVFGTIWAEKKGTVNKAV